ncbi:amidohydrolase [Prauserella aidingensis]|uniref:amidohydrolase n=1 Tax=Prauserella aidingensis TaxID=387890 RepID=UPI0020A25F0D|nr:amidohydrolase [Prauserella aidingensis]MCP2253360.1 amidohydrolase [Prauserella aidingensis]
MTRELRPTVSGAVAAVEDRLVALSHDLHAAPEVAWEEVRSSARVAGELADAGFDVQERWCGLDTAFLATAGGGPLHVALCAEYDALPGLGHACGHNVIAAISVGAALALAPLADDLGLTVHVAGTPAEEGGGGKIELLDRGGFDGMHLAALVHPGPVDVAEAEPYAVSHSRVSYEGRAAHAAAYPERGLNAADAFTVAQVALGLLRQQLPASVRVHGIVTEAGTAPNAIPGHAEGRWYVRASDLDELAEVEQRVRRCFEAGALATGCDVWVEPESKPYASFRNDAELTGLYVTAASELGRTFTTGPDARMNRASTDLGNVSQVVPSIHPYIGIDSLPAVNHQAEFAEAAAAPAADVAVVQGGQALALTVARAAADDAIRTRLLTGR